LLTTAVLITAVALSFGGGVPAAVHYIAHDKVTEVMSKGGPIVNDPGLIVLAQRLEITERIRGCKFSADPGELSRRSDQCSFPSPLIGCLCKEPDTALI
jgi:hypothetical protein